MRRRCGGRPRDDSVRSAAHCRRRPRIDAGGDPRGEARLRPRRRRGAGSHAFVLQIADDRRGICTPLHSGGRRFAAPGPALQLHRADRRRPAAGGGRGARPASEHRRDEGVGRGCGAHQRSGQRHARPVPGAGRDGVHLLLGVVRRRVGRDPRACMRAPRAVHAHLRARPQRRSRGSAGDSTSSAAAVAPAGQIQRAGPQSGPESLRL